MNMLHSTRTRLLMGAMLALALWAPSEAAAGRCEKLRPLRGKVCGVRCDSQSGYASIKFKNGDPGTEFFVMLDDCVRFSVRLDGEGKAAFELDDLVGVTDGYFKAIIPVEPTPEEVVIKFKVCR